MRKTVIKGIFGGKILLMLSTQWKLVMYVFILLFIYISVHYRVSDKALDILDNDQIIKELRTDYTTRFSEMQELTTAQQTETILRNINSELHVPTTPPLVVSGR